MASATSSTAGASRLAFPDMTAAPSDGSFAIEAGGSARRR